MKKIIYKLVSLIISIKDNLIFDFKNFIQNIKNFNLKNFSFKVKAFIKNPLFPVTLYKMFVKEFLYWFTVSLSLFIIIFLMADVFMKINDYISSSFTIINILMITFMYIGKAVSWTLPIAVMFGICMSLGSFYQNNELIAIFTSGVSLYKFTIPVIIISIILSLAMIPVNSNLIIPLERYRTELYDFLSKRNINAFDNVDITIRGDGNNFWNIGKFYSSKNTIEKIIVLRIDKNYRIIYRLDAARAVFSGNGWTFYQGIIREWQSDGKLTKEDKFQKRLLDFKENPIIFKKLRSDVENMTINEIKERIGFLKKINVEYYKEQTAYYKKFSFPFTLFLVALFAVGVGTVSRTNVLILSLFFSVGLAVLYYVMQLIIDVLASTGKLPGFLGAWLSLFIFIPVAIYLITKAKT